MAFGHTFLEGIYATGEIWYVDCVRMHRLYSKHDIYAKQYTTLPNDSGQERTPVKS